MKKIYIKPDIDVTLFEVSDEITASSVNTTKITVNEESSKPEKSSFESLF